MIRYFSLLLILTVVTQQAQARALDLIYKNNTGVRHSGKEKHLEAYETFLGLTAEDPYDPALLFNLGSSLTALGEEEKAAPLYKELLKNIDLRLGQSKSDEEKMELYKLKYAVLYNLGVHFQVVKEIDQALKYYQQALELNPDSKEIKTNIELLFQGGGQGKGKPDKDQKGEGEGEGEKDPNDSEGQGDKEQKPQEKPKESEKEKKQREFDQSQMSMQDLNRIMEELKQQEQNIRAKVQKKGGKDAPREKEW